MLAEYSNGESLVQLVVIARNGDGTVDLADADGVLKIGSCRVSEKSEKGRCRIIEDTKQEEPAPQLQQPERKKPGRKPKQSSN
jgi:hypothetical protein